MIRHDLTLAEQHAIGLAIDGLTGLAMAAGDAALVEHAVLAAHAMPRTLRELMVVAVRLREEEAALLLTGYLVSDADLGPTPGHWDQVPLVLLTRHDAYLLLIASLLGDVFGWTSQQDGQMVQNVLPIRGHEDIQISSNSSATLSWHVEDGWCSFMPDYVALLCLRNPDAAVTRYVDVSRLPISEKDRRLLGEPVFRFSSDYSHMPEQGQGDMAGQFEFGQPTVPGELMPVLSGDLADPYVRLDADFLDAPPGSPHADALARLYALIESHAVNVVLAPGDLLVLDNRRAVHGRAPFRARFDGTDRWLKRCYITRDPRQSRSMRSGASGRLLRS
jgi:enduracididine beta-hydroxylase